MEDSKGNKEFLEFSRNARRLNRAITNNPEMIGRVIVKMLTKMYADENDIIDYEGLKEEMIYLTNNIESKIN